MTKYNRYATAAAHAMRRSTPSVPPIGRRICAPSKGLLRADHEVTDWRRSGDHAWRVYADSRTYCGRRLGNKVIAGVKYTVFTVGGRFFANKLDRVRAPR